jgi:hypothetical protein
MGGEVMGNSLQCRPGVQEMLHRRPRIQAFVQIGRWMTKLFPAPGTAGVDRVGAFII